MSQITQFPQGITFKYPWRNYQSRVLKELDKHLQDQHLHVVSPPGSGKTVLGLEVTLRLNHPTLILAPTIAIRNQWVNRFCELFLQTETTPDWISKDIQNPKFLTVITYQGLHAACNNEITEENDPEEEEEEEVKGTQIFPKTVKTTNFDLLLAKLKKQNVGTIVVDEAHHLKNEWWKTLNRVKDSLNPFIVGLTATPPYDVSYAEWERYLALNGMVDTEITVPELIKEGDLCPHQDYIYFCLPSEDEQKKIKEFRETVEILFEELKSDETLLEAIARHPIFIDPNKQLDWIYDNIAYYSACLIFLNTNEIEIPVNHFKLIGTKKIEIPDLDKTWLSTLLEFYLFKEKTHFNSYKEHQKKVEKQLRTFSIIDHSRVKFTDNKSIENLFTTSINKLNGISEIVEFEYQQLKSNLRLVILTDYIRKEYLVKDKTNNVILNKIGVISIFEKIRRANNSNKKIGVLTGSIVIIPKDALASLQQKNKKYGIESISVSPLAFDENYLQLNITPKLKNNIVHTVTELFQEGSIEVLIGTKALLGEGWDAPAVNALILASFVGSFVLSNQMRGRAIRTQKGNSNKTGNVWHLACIDLFSMTGGRDLELMKRRFKSFVGISADELDSIESGVERLNIPEKIFTPSVMAKKNKDTFSQAAERELLKQKWQKAITEGSVLLEQIKLPNPGFKSETKTFEEVKDLYYNKTIKNLFVELGFGLLAFSEGIANMTLRNIRRIRTFSDLYTALGIIGFTGLLFFGRKIYITSTMYIKYRDITKDIQKVATALLKTLCEENLIKTPISDLNAEANVDKWGAVYCYLFGGTTYEQSLFIESLQEIITPIGNPRYVIVRKHEALGLIPQLDYHAVPTVLGKQKSGAETLQKNWQIHVGNCNLIFTRYPEGRKLLLKSRIKALSSQFDDNPERVNKWR